MGNGNFKVDPIEFFANISDGEFFEGVHHIPHGPGGSCRFHSDYLISFFLKSFSKGYKNTSLIFPWNK
jgi:hypothetical protein